MFTATITGHRPQNLNPDHVEHFVNESSRLITKIADEHDDVTFVTGLAQGLDTKQADQVLTESDAQLHVVLLGSPASQTGRWRSDDVLAFRQVIADVLGVEASHDTLFADITDAGDEGIEGPRGQVTCVPIVSNGSGVAWGESYMARNREMLGISDILVACWSGRQQGSVYGCLQIQQEMGRDTVLVTPGNETRIVTPAGLERAGVRRFVGTEGRQRVASALALHAR